MKKVGIIDEIGFCVSFSQCNKCLFLRLNNKKNHTIVLCEKRNGKAYLTASPRN